MRCSPLIRAATTAALIALAAAVAGCSGSAPVARSQGITPVTVLTGFGLLGQDSYLYLGKEKGFFTEAGVDLRIVPGKGTGDNLRILASGKATFAVVDLTGAIIAHGKGNRDFTTIAAIYQRSVSTITTLDSKGITRPTDLAGKRIGYQAGGVNHTLFPAYAKVAKLDPQTVRWVPSAPQQLRGLLATGAVDAITETVIGTAGVQAAAKGRKAVVLPYSDVLTDLYGNVVVTAGDTARTDLARRFRTALLRSLVYGIDHPREAGEAFHRAQPHYPAEVAAAETEAMVAYVRAGSPADAGRIAPERVARSIALLQGHAGVEPGIQPDDVVNFALADPAA